MNTEWIDINLPWSDLPKEDDEHHNRLRAGCDMTDKETAKFGTTADALLNIMGANLTDDFAIEREIEAAYELEHGELDYDMEGYDEANEARHKITQRLATDEIHRRDPERAKIDDMYHAINEWREQQPEFQAAVQAWNDAEDAADARLKANTFVGRDLANPGVQIELEDGERYLIGTINQNGGVCDDCKAFEGSAIVKRYRVLVESSLLVSPDAATVLFTCGPQVVDTSDMVCLDDPPCPIHN